VFLKRTYSYFYCFIYISFLKEKLIKICSNGFKEIVRNFFSQKFKNTFNSVDLVVNKEMNYDFKNKETSSENRVSRLRRHPVHLRHRPRLFSFSV